MHIVLDLEESAMLKNPRIDFYTQYRHTLGSDKSNFYTAMNLILTLVMVLERSTSGEFAFMRAVICTQYVLAFP